MLKSRVSHQSTPLLFLVILVSICNSRRSFLRHRRSHALLGLNRQLRLKKRLARRFKQNWGSGCQIEPPHSTEPPNAKMVRTKSSSHPLRIVVSISTILSTMTRCNSEAKTSPAKLLLLTNRSHHPPREEKQVVVTVKVLWQ